MKDYEQPPEYVYRGRLAFGWIKFDQDANGLYHKFDAVEDLAVNLYDTGLVVVGHSGFLNEFYNRYGRGWR